MNKTEVLKDGSRVTIRLIGIDDLDKLMDFFRALPEEDRRYLRVDVTNREIVKSRLEKIKDGSIIRIAAFMGDRIVGDGAVEFFDEEWRRHQTELRVIISRDFQRKGLGTIMMRELYFLALERKAEVLIVRMMRPQTAARNICRKLGFRESVMIPDYLRDRTGHPQDMIVMTCDMNECWKEMEHLYQVSDWQKYR